MRKNYGIRKLVNMKFDDAVEKTREELKKQGFGVLTEIDVKKTLKNKLNVDYDNYIILGACYPSFSYEALKVEKEIGLLLPCNVIVYEENGNIIISAIDPERMMSVAQNSFLNDIAKEVGRKLREVIKNI